MRATSAGDQTGQFHACPAVSDGQLLFMQHILWQLDKNGIAVEVHNGSTLFSGDAGGGESNIRKYIFDQDWVEAIIQMPSDEFFNTGIYTYLWIMNKNKPTDRCGKVMLINGSNGWKLLKKSKGSKRREMLPEHRRQIVEALTRFEDCEIGKVFSKEHFYYNKQQIVLIDIDNSGKSALSTVCKDAKAHKLTVDRIELEYETIEKMLGLSLEGGKDLLERLKKYDTCESTFIVYDNKDGSYRYSKSSRSIVYVDAVGISTDLGNGKFTFKASNSAKTQLSSVFVSIEPVYINDYEIIPYSSNDSENEELIDNFLHRYIFKPYYKKDNTVGVELNFNKEFYVPEEIGSVEDILDELKELDKELEEIEV